jgi:thiamine-phosphate pyrophosphorylase
MMTKTIGRVHVLTDTVLQSRFSHLEIARHAAAGGADVIQYRQKLGSTREMIETCRDLKRLCAEMGMTFIVNDRLDVALASEADGVHLGQDDFPIPLAREILGEGRIIGGSASTRDEVLRCVEQGADYIGFGPIYPTSSKDDAAPVRGLNLLRDVTSACPIPVIAIGGIAPENAAEILEAGGRGIAVISAVCCREDPEGATRNLVEAVRRASWGADHG